MIKKPRTISAEAQGMRAQVLAEALTFIEDEVRFAMLESKLVVSIPLGRKVTHAIECTKEDVLRSLRNARYNAEMDSSYLVIRWTKRQMRI